MGFWSDRKVLITGGTGFLGRHLERRLRAAEPRALRSVGSKDFDLTRDDETARLFAEFKPDVVFHLAGLVGGILANRERPADFFHRNLLMGTLTMHHAALNGVDRFIAAGAGCGYPETAPLPLKESDLWNGWPQADSAPYSLAKRLLTVQAEAYHRQHGLAATICIPGNVYGEFDNFHLQEAHVVPALVRKFVEAEQNSAPTLEVWGDGSPTRDFIHAEDVADGLVKSAELYDRAEVVNLASGQETSVREVCDALRACTGYRGEIRWNTERPSGQSRRRFDVSKAERDLEFRPRISLSEGLARTADWYRRHASSPGTRR